MNGNSKDEDNKYNEENKKDNLGYKKIISQPFSHPKLRKKYNFKARPMRPPPPPPFSIKNTRSKLPSLNKIKYINNPFFKKKENNKIIAQEDKLHISNLLQKEMNKESYSPVTQEEEINDDIELSDTDSELTTPSSEINIEEIKIRSMRNYLETLKNKTKLQETLSKIRTGTFKVNDLIEKKINKASQYNEYLTKQIDDWVDSDEPDELMDLNMINENFKHFDNILDNVNKDFTFLMSNTFNDDNYEPDSPISLKGSQLRKRKGIIKDTMYMNDFAPMPAPIPDPTIREFKNAPHVRNIYNNTGVINKMFRKKTFKCPDCNVVLSSETSLNIHYANTHIHINYQNHNQIPTNPFGKFMCPKCPNRYTSEEYLGEHFINEHNDYDELNELDNKKNEMLGFPGFDILEFMNVIKRIPDNQYIKKQKCSICYRNFKFEETEYELDNSPLIDGYMSDDQLYKTKKVNINYDYEMKPIIKNKKTNHVRKVDNNNNNFFVERDFSNDLYNSIETRKDKVLPMKTCCCNVKICEYCAEKHFKHNGRIECPFCYKDFEESKSDYIVFEIIPSDETDFDKWRNWRERHLNDFD